MPAASARRALALTSASSSPCCSRRSECPTTHVACSPARPASTPTISPVWAPPSCADTSCAPYAQRQPVAVDEGLHAAQVGERRAAPRPRPVGVVRLVPQRPGQPLHQHDRLEVVEVRLPVAGHQRQPGGLLRGHRLSPPGPRGRAGSCPRATPGWRRRRSRCGRTRRRRSRAVRTAAAESPPPTTVSPSQPVSASRHRAGAGANCSISNTPIGPFQNTVRRLGDLGRRTAAADSGPMSSPIRSSGISSAGTTLPARRRVDLVGHHDVGRQHDPDARCARPGRGSRARCRAGPPRAGCDPTSWPWAARKVKTMPPPISSTSATSEQVVDDAELVRHLRAAEHDDVRALRARRPAGRAPRPRCCTSPPAACGSRCATS